VKKAISTAAILLVCVILIAAVNVSPPLTGLSDIIAALGYTPANKAGDTFTGEVDWQINGGTAFAVTEEMWDDSQVPPMTIQLGAAALTLENFIDGTSKVYCFNNNQDDTGYASVQLSHRYKQATGIRPHVHWCETATTSAGTNVVFELAYSWANINGEFPAFQTLLTTNSITGTNWFHQMSVFSEIDGTGKNISSIFAFRIRRLASSATADDYDQNAAFLGFDIHYQIDSPGSDAVGTKSY
jgi:hypothetical protein